MTRSLCSGKTISVATCLTCALSLIVLQNIRNKQSATDVEPSSPQEKHSSQTPHTSKEKAKREGVIYPRPLGASVEIKDDLAGAVDSSEVESILSDAALSFEESATRLLESARREDLPMEARLDALDHAFNLDRWQAMTLCMEQPLAKPIAERLMSGIYNHGEAPKDQVSACMHLMLHDDAEIREQARGLLAFLISAEEHTKSPEKLREVADAFLKQAEEGDALQGAEVDSE
jgi:hypothetical protein